MFESQIFLFQLEEFSFIYPMNNAFFSPTVLYRPTIPKDYDLNINEEDIVKPIEHGRESSVPASRVAR